MFDRDTREFFSDTNCSMIIDPIKKQEFQESVEYIYIYIYTRGKKGYYLTIIPVIVVSE